MIPVGCRWAAEDVLHVRPLAEDGEEAWAAALALAEGLSQALAEDAEVVMGPGSVAVYFSLERLSPEQVREAVRRVAARASPVAPAGRTHTLPVWYGGTDGPDLAEVARQVGLPAREVALLHASGPYRVRNLGFLPGFPYLAGLPPRLHVPRRATPRPRVPAGSVAIAGEMTGIYPQESPGGWHLLGRTPVCLFDVRRSPPALLLPGDTVRFDPVAIHGEE